MEGNMLSEHCGFQAEKPVLSPRAPSPETLVLSLV